VLPIESANSALEATPANRPRSACLWINTRAQYAPVKRTLCVKPDNGKERVFGWSFLCVSS
jgi:hypothetical protein